MLDEQGRISSEDEARLQKDFVYHAPSGDQPERYEILRDSAMGYARLLIGSCPPSRELSLSLTKLEEAVFWANAAIARNE